MDTSAPSRPTPTVAELILSAAAERFARFGYNKTTMAEIAGDCGMSAANLYRYFDNKLDIGTHLARDYLEQRLAQQREAAETPGLSHAQRLRAVVFALFAYTHDQWTCTPLINELVAALCGERSDIVGEYKQREQALLAELLAAGNAAGEFDVADVAGTAEAIQTATTLFSMPLLMPVFPREVFEQKAESLVRLLLEGILAPTHRRRHTQTR